MCAWVGLCVVGLPVSVSVPKWDDVCFCVRVLQLRNGLTEATIGSTCLFGVQRRRVPAKALPLFVPLALHANLAVNLHLPKELELQCLQLLFVCVILQSPPLSIPKPPDLFPYRIFFDIFLALLNW